MRTSNFQQYFDLQDLDIMNCLERGLQKLHGMGFSFRHQEF
jgi:hypothetical protein